MTQPTRRVVLEIDPVREARRVAALDRLRILDTLREHEFDDLAILAAQVCDVPIALVSLVASDRQWFKAAVGLDAQQTHRDIAFCAHAIETPDDLFLVEDASRDARFRDNPLVTGPPDIRFYAGAPIVDRDGLALGTVCVIDTKAGKLDATKRRCLEALARHASLLLDLRRQAIDATIAEETLLERNESLEHVVDRRTRELDRLWSLSEDLLAVIDRRGRLIRVGRSWSRVLGHDEATLLSMSYADLVHPDHRAFAQAWQHGSGADDRPVRFDHRLRTVNGSWRWIQWTWSPEPDGANLVGIGRDVTETRERESALEAAEAALRQSQKMEALGQLTGGLAHDFNNLLTGISGSLELLQLRVAEGRVRELDRYLVAAQGAARRAAALTHRLLAFARRQTLDPKATDINRLIAEMEELIRRTVGPQIVLDVGARRGLWTAMVDANQLENALLNLCINARDAMPGGGRLAIATDNRLLDAHAARSIDLAEGQYLLLSVSDSGSGMSDEVIARAFDPFFTTKPLGSGTGLGLSMVYGFARQSGGQVRIQSNVGRGTTVSIYLPRHPGEAEAAAEETRVSLEPAASLGETVLVIDDEPTVRMLVAEVLDDLGYRCIEAQDGPSGLQLLREAARIDLLITDVGLPGGLNGRQVADAARLLKPDLRILFITGYAESAVVGNGDLDPGMALLTKPFSLDVLAQRVSEMLAPRGTE